MATLGSQAVGSIVKLNVNGTAWNWIVVHQGLPGSMYDASCDGTWLLMQDVYVKLANGTDVYEKSDANTYFNSTFYGLLDDWIKGVVKQVKIPHVTESYTLATGENGLSVKIFSLSGVECGFSDKNLREEGTVLSYFNGASDAKRIAYYNGDEENQVLRSPYSGYGYCAIINRSGKIGYSLPSSANGQRPAMILPANLTVTDDGTITESTGAITGSVTIGGVQRELTGNGYINIGGVLRELSDSQVNIGGILKSLKG